MATIAENLERIQSAKTDIKTAIEAKGVTVPSSATIDTYADYVSQISGGGGSSADTALSGIIDRSITSIDIPSGITSIGVCAFYHCHSLTSATIPNSVTSIMENAFDDCYYLASISIPSGVTSIGANAFQNSYRLTSIDIPDSVTSIGNYAFNFCSGLRTCTIGSGVTSIGTYAFRGCSTLSSITINAATPPTLSNANAFNNTNNCPIYVPSGSVDTYKAANNWSSLASRIQAIPT